MNKNQWDNHLEQRKLQKLGASSLIVTLPKRWVDRLGLKPGDTVYVRVMGDHLNIIPSRLVKQEEKLVLSVGKDVPEELSHIMVNCLYTLGVNDAIIKIEKPHDKESLLLNIKSVSQDLIGVDIIEEVDGELELKVFIDNSKLSVETVTRNFTRIISLLISYIENTIKTGKGSPRNLEVIKRDLIRYEHLLLRLLHEKGKERSDSLSTCIIETGT
jgi:AbrB family looped-hinge helix DNA binding protein